MNKNAIYAIIAVVVVVAAGSTVAFMTMNKDDEDKNRAYDDTTVRLRIFGNANGDDIIDNNDVKTIQKIIDEKYENWKTDYYFADADQDGDIDQDDITVVNKIINKEKVKMWYENSFSTLNTYADGTSKRINTYINYPLGHKVGCETFMVDFLCCLGLYDYFSATEDSLKGSYDDSTYPGISKLPSMGRYTKLDCETLMSMYDAGTIDTLLMWTGGMATPYLWEDADKSGLAEKISIVMVTCQGETCVNGVMMLACMFGDQHLSDKYVAWYEKNLVKLNKIGVDFEKKTVMAIQCWESTTSSNIRAYHQYQSPALWFNKVMTFADFAAGTAGFTSIGQTQNLQKEMERLGITDIITMTQANKDHAYENYNKYIEEKYYDVFKNLPSYEAQTIYPIEFAIMPFFAGPASCSVLAAFLYPDHFDMEESLALLQEYLDNFTAPGTHHDAKVGYTYTGTGYYKG